MVADKTAGRGRIALELHGSEAVFTELSSAYPLKLLSPRTRRVGLVYLITYGGGLVSGDQVALSVDVGLGANLVLLSQGSTKVFKFRPGQRAASTDVDAPQVTTQRMDFAVASSGSLFLLPDPVTCFAKASYNQIQTFRLAPDASLAVLDWVTSGRKSRGEEWVFSRYYSVNEIVVDGRRVAKDVMLLENEDEKENTRTLASRLEPYGCYATLLLYGPQVQGVVSALTEEYGRIQVFKTNERPGLLWSFSGFGDGGGVVRIAGKETEEVRRWIGNALRPLEMVVGREIFQRIIS
ncbi:UreD urease accessory protein-domain-containing protein [Mycena albidolilacea]|uniref:UreD urease accessory protein-domain-containing protein n=1 Tax=Mycena albidolilacea TaxID=1033008 RepID=A0AAD7AG52_9AGAR|nr:UreD urease accessory protein-domain-containing protein [Mycena albidolilacea]